MSRGLGKLQRDIVAHLEKSGKPCWVQDIVWTLYNAGRDPDGYHPERPTHSFSVSVMRAASQLKRRGLMNTAYVYEGKWDSPRWLTKCWLTGQTEPDGIKTRLNSDDICKVVLGILADVDREKLEADGWWFVFKFDAYKFEKGLIPYHYLTHFACKQLGTGGFVEGRAAVAVHRAVKRLAKEGKIRAFWVRVGRYGWVGLPGPYVLY